MNKHLTRIALAAAGLLIGMACAANALPYFRPLDLQHIEANTGALIPLDKGPNDAVGMVPLATHSHLDGHIFFPGEDWTPLAVGIGGNLASDPFFAFGPSVNVTPVAKAVLLSSLKAVSAEGDDQTLKRALSPGESTLNFAIGPTWIIKPTEHWKGYMRIFIGGAWKF